LKLDLDRFLSEISKQMREQKKGADDFVATGLAARLALSDDGEDA
jgi:pyrimidine operon attenuation protein/uracil phosphoribosyltransferase